MARHSRGMVRIHDRISLAMGSMAQQRIRMLEICGEFEVQISCNIRSHLDRSSGSAT